MRALALALAASLLAACGGGSSDASRACVTISGGTTQVTTSPQALCSGCTIANGPNAIDGDMTTSATAAFDPSGTGTLTIRATAQQGVVFPAGSQAGAFLTFVAQDPAKPYLGVYVDTYLGGVRQDRIWDSGGFVGSSSSGNFGYGCNKPCDGSRRNITGSAPRDFDAVEIGLARDKSGVTEQVEVAEFCSDLRR
jgi:hypothetical protein